MKVQRPEEGELRTRVKWVTPAVALLALLGTAVTVAGTATAHRTAAGPPTYTINVDGRHPKVNESFLAFFPHAITVHAGDTVVFHYVGVGEPHTVTLGTLANAAVKDYNELTPK